MKKQILTVLMAAGLVVSCTKSTTKTEQVENPDGSVTTTSTTVTQSPTDIVDTSKVNKAKEDVKAKVDAAGDKIDNAAHKTKTELNEAGKDIKAGAKEIGKDVKDAAAKGAGKVEEGAKKLKEDLKK
ncbi:MULTISPECIES: hypothetical protein [Chryseobacterium]|uniref:hypothetical protein n=1 Tax=Chryseobacterium TaxID=59732 RepID=UPI001BE6AE28|nr:MULTISPECIES: hypothetical protein [Chryseobacterium]MBT2621398.1 hypothetical protein [Chryseobacterium sp. ISL-6]